MSLRAIRTAELTPDARIDAAKRKLVEAIDELVEARIAKGSARSEWVDQDSSPLGRDRHLRLVRRGVLKAVREGRRRLVRRADLEAYLEANSVQPPTVEGEEGEVEAMMRRIAGGER